MRVSGWLYQQPEVAHGRRTEIGQIRDGLNAREANIVAHHYRLNNMKWYALEEPVDDGDYWAFKLIHGRTYEPVDEPPLLVYKRAWSYKSAVVVGGKPNRPPEPPGR